MARTLSEIKKSMTDVFISNQRVIDLYNIQPNRTFEQEFSALSIESILFYAVAFCVTLHEQIFDLFKQDVVDFIFNKDPHTPQWYVNKTKEFQYGFDLVPEYDFYDNTGVPADTVAASKIVAYAAFVEEPFVRLKLAKLVGSDLAPLNDEERLGVVTYVKRFKDAGVKLKNETITSTPPDNLKLSLRVKYNPMVLNADGTRLDGTASAPVKDGIKEYLRRRGRLDFNGVFSVQKLVDQIQLVEGVTDLHIDGIQAKYGALPFTTVDIDFIPDSGYLVIEDADLAITYIPA